MNWQLLTEPTTFASPLVLALVAEHGPDVVVYEPETIRECLRKHNPKVSESLVVRVNAALGLFTSNAFWKDPATFNIVSRALNRAARPMAAPADIEDMAWGVTEAGFLLMDSADEQSTANVIGPAVAKYVTVALNREGMYTVPDALSFAQPVRPAGIVDIPEQTLSLQQRADEEAIQINNMVNEQMSMVLQQINDARIPLQKEAQAQLNAALTNLR